jgi:hypothetical protein
MLSVIAGLLAVAIGLQSALPRSSGGGNTMISPTVFATWVTERTGNDPEQLRLLVLWRGTPGWFFSQGVAGSGVRSGRMGARGHVTVEFGVRMTVEYGADDVVAINGREMHLGSDNVVYVDDVDGLAGARVARTSRIASKMPGSAGQIGLAIRDVPDIVAYLQCDARASDPQRQTMIERAAACVVSLGRQGLH